MRRVPEQTPKSFGLTTWRDLAEIDHFAGQGKSRRAGITCRKEFGGLSLAASKGWLRA